MQESRRGPGAEALWSAVSGLGDSGGSHTSHWDRVTATQRISSLDAGASGRNPVFFRMRRWSRP